MSRYVLIAPELLQRAIELFDKHDFDGVDSLTGECRAIATELRSRLAHERSAEWVARKVASALHAYLTTEESKNAVAGESANASLRWSEGFLAHLDRGVKVAVAERSLVPGFADVNAQLEPSGWALELLVDEATRRLEEMMFVPLPRAPIVSGDRPERLPPECPPSPDLVKPANIKELVARLRANAQTCREEQTRALPAESKIELANNAREWDGAADALEQLTPSSYEADPRNEPDIT